MVHTQDIDVESTISMTINDIDLLKVIVMF